MSEKASSKTIPTKTLGELLDSFREYVQEILEINEPQTNLLIAKARQKRFIDANVLRQKLPLIVTDIKKKISEHIDLEKSTPKSVWEIVFEEINEQLLIGLEEAKKP